MRFSGLGEHDYQSARFLNSTVYDFKPEENFTCNGFSFRVGITEFGKQASFRIEHAGVLYLSFFGLVFRLWVLTPLGMGGVVFSLSILLASPFAYVASKFRLGTAWGRHVCMGFCYYTVCAAEVIVAFFLLCCWHSIQREKDHRSGRPRRQAHMETDFINPLQETSQLWQGKAAHMFVNASFGRGPYRESFQCGFRAAALEVAEG